MRKALHLEADKLSSIQLDGEALKITMKSQSPLRFPLWRISRITISGYFPFPVEDLICCAKKQILVTFLDQRGRVRAQLVPYQQQPAPLLDYLQQVEFCTIYKAAFEEWELLQRRHILGVLGMESGIEKRRDEEHQAALLKAVKSSGIPKKQYLTGVDWLLGLFRAHLEQVMCDLGLPSSRPELQPLKLSLELIFLPMLRDVCAEQLRAAGRSSSSHLESLWAMQTYHHIEQQINITLPISINTLLWQFEGVSL